MKKTLVFILLILCFQTTFAQTLNFVRQMGSINGFFATGISVAVDATSNIYAIGRFENTTDFGGTSLTALGSVDLCVAKYSSAGTLQWVRQAGAAGNFGGIESHEISIDNSGNVYVIGQFNGSINFAGTIITAIDNQPNTFFAKYNNNGTLQWVKRFGVSLGLGIAAAKVSGNIYLTGRFSGTVDFGGTSLTSVGGGDFYCAKYNTEGILQWVRQAGASGQANEGDAIEVDASENVFVTGAFGGVTNFSGTNLTAFGTYDIFVASYNSNGAFQWVKQAGAVNEINYPTDIAIDATGNVLVTGSFRGTTNFGSGIIITPSFGQGVFVAKYSNLGNIQWAKQAGSANGNAITTDAADNVYVTGVFNRNTNFSGISLTLSGITDIFIAKYNSAGTIQFAYKAGGNGETGGRGIAVDASSNIYAIGYFSQTNNFFGTNLTAIGDNTDMFLLGINSGNNCPPSLSPTGTITTNQKAATTVISTGTNTIPNAANVTYQAGNYVQLNAGFSAVSSSVFTAKILAGCQ
jgi:Beta-propeller repeat